MSITDLKQFQMPIIAGNDLIIPVTIVEDDDPDTPVNLAGASMTFQLREILGPDCIAETALLSKSIGSGVVVVDAAAGMVEIRIDADDGPALQRPCAMYAVLMTLALTGPDGIRTTPLRQEARVRPF
jgi:hypothetical protein